MIDTLRPASASSSTLPSTLPTTQQQPKLTKKQRKSLAFRDKSSKSRTKDTIYASKDGQEVEMEDLHVPNVEKPPRARHASPSLQMGDMEDQIPKGTSRGGETAYASTKRTPSNPPSSQQEIQDLSQRQNSLQKHKRVGKVGVTRRSGNDGEEDKKSSKKRKRADLDGVVDELETPGQEDGNTKEKARNKKRKSEKAESGVDGVEEEEGEEMNEGDGAKAGKKGKGKEGQRFILFIGNLKYTTSVDAIKTHFSACDPPPNIRLLTPKASATGKTTTKSKGCAFLEFSNKISLQQALKQHHSMLEGRMINVELTAGGGGKGEKRMEKLRERNKELLGQRTKKAEKKGKKDGSLPSRPDKPQRYSATSGIEQSSSESKRTWTVGDAAEDEVHRGGQKHSKKTRGSRKSKTKDWGTGVNAIPVG